MDYKQTLNLPKTNFPMKASLTQREPERLKKWEKENILSKIKKSRKDSRKFVLHDGPPYANGHIHMGHILNKVLKDFVLKYKTLQGYYTPYVPGWDCHGLPVEHRLLKEMKATKNDVDQVDFRKKAHDYALKWVNIQKEEFKRFGIFGEWDSPYLTMDKEYEYWIVKSFYAIFNNGHIVKGKKPIYWCFDCETALAEAEVEYEDVESPSLYVRFPMEESAKEYFNIKSEKPLNIIIWTTTPWTLPANKAVAVHPDFKYILEEKENEIMIIAKELRDNFHQETGFSEGKILKEIKGLELENRKYTHIINGSVCPVILSEYVTLEQGTGCVHTAPGHGQEDFVVGKRYGLEVFSPVDNKGRLTEEAKICVGENVFKANKKIIEELDKKGFVIYNERFTHSYPHCWRCKKPVIFRATSQWFISLEEKNLKQSVLEDIKKIKWIPGVGESRITAMVEKRPEWCISRQRLWGVPIPVFYCKKCGNLVINDDIQDNVLSKVREYGTDIWFEKSAEFFIPDGISCEKCGSKEFEKESDILDVWFDSGTSHQGVLRANPELKYPCDLYLEGSDQHRGWFQSALLTAKAIGDERPMDAVLTHGFVVDGDGRKMSKSLGNVVDPFKLLNKYGADILRLWVASMNYFVDVRISDEILGQIADAYRKIRNTFRFMLGNCFDFVYDKNAVSQEEMKPRDIFMLIKFKNLVSDCKDYYENYEFHRVFRSIYNFCTVDLSSYYLDILKNKLYTDYYDSLDRRSAQTSMFIISKGLCKIISPLVPFTADEIWENINHGENAESVHYSLWPEIEISKNIDEKNIIEKYSKLIDLRNKVLLELEKARNEKIIGSSLEAKIKIATSDSSMYEFLISVGLEELKETFIVSDVEIILGKEKFKIYAEKSQGVKCIRCWQYKKTTADDGKYKGLCKECVEVVEKLNINH